MANGEVKHMINAKDFVLEQHILSSSVTIGASGTAEVVETVTKTGGWWPVCISGYSYTGYATQFVFLYTEAIFNQSEGSASIRLRLKNIATSEVQIGNVSVLMLWARVN